MHYKEHIWNLDIWFQIPEWNRGNINAYEQKLSELSEEQRITVLKLKEVLLNEGTYGVGKEFLSVDVYNGVLDHDVKTVAELRANK